MLTSQVVIGDIIDSKVPEQNNNDTVPSLF
jgi:hypothetical protein